MFKKSVVIILIVFFCFSMTITSLAAGEGHYAGTGADYSGYTQIADAEGLSAIANDPGGNYVLAADINMKDVHWYPIEFSGILDGNGHKIYNLDITETNEKSYSTYDGNHKKYDTHFAGLFSKTESATIKNLNLLNVNIKLKYDSHIFAGGIAGFSDNSEVTGCSVSGRIFVSTPGQMFGAGGVVGFGTGAITDCKADVTLVIVDDNPDQRCEAFMGGILACGCSNIDGCTVNVTGYASLTGYMHTGGVVGMFHKHIKTDPNIYHIRNCTITGKEYYFEHNPDKRRYCYAVYGEIFKHDKSKSYDNKVISFEKHEYFKYDKVLLPEECDTPEYTSTVTEPTCTDFGYTTYTCKTCGYSYTDEYTAPAHKPGDWVIDKQPTYFEYGESVRHCSVCGELLDTEEILRLKFRQDIEAESSTKVQLKELLPQGNPYAELIWASSDENIAKVDEDGEIDCLGCGSVVVTCSSTDGFVFAEYYVNIKYQADINAEYKTSLRLSDKLPKGQPADGIIWSSSDEKVAAIDANGDLNCTGRGDVVITGRTADGTEFAQLSLNVAYTWWQWLIIIFLFGWIWY